MDLKSNEPFWLVKNGIVHSYPSLKETVECEVLVIGGGITGSLIAHQMVKDGYETVLIDRREIGNGSTSATTSMLQYEIDVPLYELIDQIGEEGAVKAYKACSQSIEDLDKITQELNSEAGFERKESLYYASKKKDVSWLKKEFEARENAGFNIKWIEKEEILERYEFENTFGGILSSQGASVDAFHLAHELLAFNSKKGLRVYDKTEMDSVEVKKGFNLVTTKTRQKIKAQKIIYAIGYESAHLIKEKFVDLKSTFAMVSEIDEKGSEKLNNTLFWNTSDPYLYMRTTSDGRVLIGGGDEDFRDPEKRDAMIDKKEKEILRDLKDLLPNYHFYTDFTWAGTFGETKDGLPYIGEHKDFPNSYFVLGFGGNGITFSVTGMEMASAFMKNKNHPLTEYFKFGR